MIMPEVENDESRGEGAALQGEQLETDQSVDAEAHPSQVLTPERLRELEADLDHTSSF